MKILNSQFKLSKNSNHRDSSPVRPKIVFRFLADLAVRLEGRGLEFHHVASFDKFNLIGGRRKLARAQRDSPPLHLFLLSLCRGLSERTPKIQVSDHRHKEVYEPVVVILGNFVILGNCYWWPNKFFSSLRKNFQFPFFHFIYNDL